MINDYNFSSLENISDQAMHSIFNNIIFDPVGGM